MVATLQLNGGVGRKGLIHLATAIVIEAIHRPVPIRREVDLPVDRLAWGRKKGLKTGRCPEFIPTMTSHLLAVHQASWEDQIRQAIGCRAQNPVAEFQPSALVPDQLGCDLKTHWNRTLKGFQARGLAQLNRRRAIAISGLSDQILDPATDLLHL